MYIRMRGETKWTEQFIHYIDGEWFWEDETGAFSDRGYEDKEEARQALMNYADDLGANT